jgi:hypothetical protein
MRLARWVSAVAAVVAMVALPAAAGAELTFNLPAQIFKVFDQSGKTPPDPNRCDAIVFVEFPKIKHAVSYRITVSRNGPPDEFMAPPFDLFGRGFIARFPPPKGFARFFVSAYSTPDGCAAADVQTDEAKIADAEVSLDKPFEKRFKRILSPPWKRAYKPGEKSATLGRWWRDPRKIIVRRGGEVTAIDEDSNQPVNVFTNRYALRGTIVRTGPRGVVQIGALDGGSVLVGPNMTIRLTRQGFDVLEEPIPVKPWGIPHRSGPDYKVRTDNAVLSARG